MISRGSIIFSRHPDRARPAGRARRLSTHAAPSSKSLRPRRADPHGYAVDLDLDPSSTGLDLAMPQPPLRNSGRSHIHNRRHELQPISIRPSCTRPTRSSASTARSSGAPRWSTSSPTRMPSSASSERSCSSRTMSGPSSVPVPDTGNHRAVERSSRCQPSGNRQLTCPALAGERGATPPVTPRRGTRSTRSSGREK